jgi:capsular exopolysaccharide synthesis family protein
VEQIKNPSALIKSLGPNDDLVFQRRRNRDAPEAADPENAWLRLTKLDLDPDIIARNHLFANAQDPGARYFDHLRTRTAKHMRKRGLKRLAITSPNEGCGKSTIAANLALSLARQPDYRVMLFDFDLRQPTLAYQFGLEQMSPRLTALQGSRRKFDSTTLRPQSNLSLSLNLTPEPNAAEILSTEYTRYLLDHIQQDFAPDLMIFDLPPLLNFDDAVVAMDFTDATLLVARADYNTVNQVDEAEKLITEHSKCLGTVLNQCRFD